VGIRIDTWEENHQILDLWGQFTEEKLKFIKIKSDRTFSVERVTRIGIVQVNCEGKPHFIHCTLPSILLQIIGEPLDRGEQNKTDGTEFCTEGYISGKIL